MINPAWEKLGPESNILVPNYTPVNVGPCPSCHGRGLLDFLKARESDGLIERWTKRCPDCAGRGKLSALDKTGKVRGLLCAACNVAIAQLGDCPEGLLKALKYLTKQA